MGGGGVFFIIRHFPYAINRSIDVVLSDITIMLHRIILLLDRNSKPNVFMDHLSYLVHDKTDIQHRILNLFRLVKIIFDSAARRRILLGSTE